jgi:tetratricopeptide (TPR) repeat protein
LRLGRYKYIEAPKPEFYDLSQDPGEQQNVYSQQKAIALTYRERLLALYSRFRKTELADQALSPEAVAALSSLGYVALSTTKSGSPDLGSDPKDRIADFESARQAIDLSSSGRLAEANLMFERLCSKFPDIVDLRTSLGVNQRRMGKKREAADSFRQVLKQDPLNVRAHFDLAVSLSELQQPDDALKELKVVLGMAPYYSRAEEMVGTILLQKRDYIGARSHFNEMLAKDPASYVAHYNLGTLATNEKRWEEGEHHLIAATKSDPKSAEAYNGLGWHYLLRGDLEQAHEALVQAIRLEPKFAETHFNLGLVFRQQKRMTWGKSLQCPGLGSPLPDQPARP